MCTEWPCPFNEDALGNKSVGTCIATNLKSDFRLVAIFLLILHIIPTIIKLDFGLVGGAI